MVRPVVGVIANAHRIEGRISVQLAGEQNLRALAEVANALPVMFAGASDITDIGALLEVVDGVVLTGGRTNVHPSRFRIEPHPAHEPYDEDRDALALALIEVCVARGVPIFGICRGFQEMNVAFGGSLHPEIRDLPGRMNHRMVRLDTGEAHPDPAVVFGDRHEVRFVPGGRSRKSSVGRKSALTLFMVRAFSSPASASSSREWPRTAPSRRFASRTRQASRLAFNGTPSPIRNAIP